MSIYSAWRFHNKDLFSKCSYYSKNFEPMKAKRKLLSKNHAGAAGTRLRSSQRDLPQASTAQEHILSESPLRAPEVALNVCQHEQAHIQATALLPPSAAFSNQFLGCTAMEGICILTVCCNSVHKCARCMLIVAGLIRTGCSCPWRHLLSNGTCVCREVTTPKPAGATVPGNTCFNK